MHFLIRTAVILALMLAHLPASAAEQHSAADLPPLSPLTPPASPVIALPRAADAAPSLLIYLAKGPADSCGPGCDRWIAVEGNVDARAAARITAFLRGVKDNKRPIYFQSPGGEVDPSLEIGRLLRARKATARVGQTLVQACAGTQVDADCLAIKEAGGELDARLTTQKAICASACVYILLGATTREVAPDAGLAVHDAKLFLKFRTEPTPQERAMTQERLIARSRRELSAYVAAMGIDAELMVLTRSVPFEKGHLLTRAELYRFGIDRRSFVETPWQLITLPRAHLSKKAVGKAADGVFRPMEWQLYCTATTRAHLLFTREVGGPAVPGRQLRLMADTMTTALNAIPIRFGQTEIWQAVVTDVALSKWASVPRLLLGEGAPVKGEVVWTDTAIDTLGLDDGLKAVAAACPKPQLTAPPAGKPSAPMAQIPKTVVLPGRKSLAPSAISAGTPVGGDIVFGKPPVFVTPQ